MEHLNGQMVEHTKDIGRMENSMEKEYQLTKKDKKLKQNGLRGKELEMNELVIHG